MASYCHCAECQRLDRLPVRRHGIPGARQLVLPAGALPFTRDLAPTPIEASPPPQPGLEGLGLFAGRLEPTLF